MRWIALPAVRFMLVVAIAFALATLIDPYLDLDSPLFAQAVNAALPVTLVLLVWALAGRAWLALVVEILVVSVLHYATVMKLLYLNTDVVYADFTVLGGLLTDPHLVLGFFAPERQKHRRDRGHRCPARPGRDRAIAVAGVHAGAWRTTGRRRGQHLAGAHDDARCPSPARPGRRTGVLERACGARGRAGSRPAG